MRAINRAAPAVLLVVLLTGAGYAKSRPAGSGTRVKQRIKPFDLPHRENGRIAWRVKGAVAHVLENGDIMLEMPAVHIVATEDKPGHDITAKKGTIADKKDTMIFEGDVKVISTDGASLVTDRLTWKVKAQTARTDSHVAIKRGKMDLSGDGLDAQVKLDRFKIRSNVRLVVRPKDPDDISAVPKRGTTQSGKPITIVSKGSMTFASGIAVFVGRPKVISGNATMICDRLDVHMDTETEAIKKAVAEGNVTLTSEKSDAECGKAVWVPDSDDLQLFTNVVVIERGTANAVRTDLAYLNPEGNRIRCMGPAVVTFHSKKKDNAKEKNK